MNPTYRTGNALLVCLHLALGAVACERKVHTETNTDAQAVASAMAASPLKFEVTAFDAKTKKFEVRAYNASEKTIAHYEFRYRFLDAAGEPIRGERLRSWTGAGVNFPPKKWSSIKIFADLIPPEAVKAELRATFVQALGSDGKTYERPPLFDKRFGSEWPEDAP